MYHTVSVRFAGGDPARGRDAAWSSSHFDAVTAARRPRRGAGAACRPRPSWCRPHLARLLALPDPDRTGSTRSGCWSTPASPVPPGGQAGRHGAGPAGRRVGVLRVDRGPVHGVPPRGVARAAGHGGPGPARTRLSIGRSTTRRRHRSGAGPCATCRSPGSATGATRPRRQGLARRGVHRRGPGPARRRRLPLPRRPAARPDHQRGGQRLPRRGGGVPWPRCPASSEVAVFGVPDERGASGCASPTSAGRRAGTTPCGRPAAPHAAVRLRRLQATQGVRRWSTTCPTRPPGKVRRRECPGISGWGERPGADGRYWTS